MFRFVSPLGSYATFRGSTRVSVQEFSFIRSVVHWNWCSRCIEWRCIWQKLCPQHRIWSCIFLFMFLCCGLQEDVWKSSCFVCAKIPLLSVQLGYSLRSIFDFLCFCHNGWTKISPLGKLWYERFPKLKLYPTVWLVVPLTRHVFHIVLPCGCWFV